MPSSAASSRNNASLIPKTLNPRKPQSPNVVGMNGHVTSGRPLSERGATPIFRRRPSSQMSGLDAFNTAQQQAFLSQTGNPDIKDLVKDAVKEYFDSMNLPQVVETQRLANPEFQGYNEKGEEVWAVVKKDPFAEMMNKNASRPNSRLMSARSPMPNAFTRSKTQYWKDDVDFQSNLQNWASSAPDHEREIVKSLLKRLNGGQTPVEVSNSEALNSGRPTRRSFSGATRLIEPIQYQCDVSMFTKPPYNPSRHFIINPEWTSERYTVKKIPAAHLHPSASLKNKLGLLRS